MVLKIAVFGARKHRFGNESGPRVLAITVPRPGAQSRGAQNRGFR